jgi:hypothetical protein
MDRFETMKEGTPKEARKVIRKIRDLFWPVNLWTDKALELLLEEFEDLALSVREEISKRDI